MQPIIQYIIQYTMYYTLYVLNYIYLHICIKNTFHKAICLNPEDSSLSEDLQKYTKYVSSNI
jgi:hypothetical protein